MAYVMPVKKENKRKASFKSKTESSIDEIMHVASYGSILSSQHYVNC